MCAWGPVFVRLPIALEPKIETETLNEWHLWTFLPSARSSPRLHRPPFKAGPFEYWRDNPLPSITKQPWECVQCVRSLSVQVLVSHSPPPLPLPFLPLKSVFSSVFWELTLQYGILQTDSVFSGALCLSGFLGAWFGFLQLMQRFSALWKNYRFLQSLRQMMSAQCEANSCYFVAKKTIQKTLTRQHIFPPDDATVWKISVESGTRSTMA